MLDFIDFADLIAILASNLATLCSLLSEWLNENLSVFAGKKGDASGLPLNEYQTDIIVGISLWLLWIAAQVIYHNYIDPDKESKREEKKENETVRPLFFKRTKQASAEKNENLNQKVIQA